MNCDSGYQVVMILPRSLDMIRVSGNAGFCNVPVCNWQSVKPKHEVTLMLLASQSRVSIPHLRQSHHAYSLWKQWCFPPSGFITISVTLHSFFSIDSLKSNYRFLIKFYPFTFIWFIIHRLRLHSNSPSNFSHSLHLFLPLTFHIHFLYITLWSCQV